MSIVMPVYNEQQTLAVAVDRVLAVDFPCQVELIIVDDGSTDRTPQILAGYEGSGVRIVTQAQNAGKGAAVQAGVRAAEGTHLIILDADLEYSPADIPRMLEPILYGQANHVFGARVFGFNAAFTSFKFAVGGRATTFIANMMFDAWLTDMHTCLKLIPTEDFRAMSFRENGFGLDTELTAQLLRAGVRPFEVPISYHGRTVAAGKKLSVGDGVRCLMVLMRQRLRKPLTLSESIPALNRGRSMLPEIALGAEQEHIVDVSQAAALASSGDLATGGGSRASL